jgi:hypothetical protein
MRREVDHAQATDAVCSRDKEDRTDADCDNLWTIKELETL